MLPNIRTAILHSIASPEYSESYVLVTPEMAREMLARRVPNRLISSKFVDQLVAEMRDRWNPRLPTRKPVTITSNGELVDGQHRLEAIIRLGRPVLMRVCVLQPEADIEGIRFGETVERPQRARDIFDAIKGTKHTNKIVGIIRTCLLLDRRKAMTDVVPTADMAAFFDGHAVATTEVVQALVNAPVRTIAVIPFGGFWLWVATGNGSDRDTFRAFAHRYLSGVGLNAGDPELTLRNFVMGETHRSADRHTFLGRVAAAYQAAYEGRQLAKVYPSAEAFRAIGKRIGKDAPSWAPSSQGGSR